MGSRGFLRVWLWEVKILWVRIMGVTLVYISNEPKDWRCDEGRFWNPQVVDSFKPRFAFQYSETGVIFHK